MKTHLATMGEWMMDAKAAARDLRRAAWNEDGKIRFPVDPYAIATKLGVEVTETPLESDVAGFIVQEEGKAPHAYLNTHDHPVRRRFTLAHELAHFIRHSEDRELAFVEHRNQLAFSGTDSEEIWANRFAAELLMPAATLSKWWAEGRSVERIRRSLNVSEPALANRLKNLGLFNG